MWTSSILTFHQGHANWIGLTHRCIMRITGKLFFWQMASETMSLSHEENSSVHFVYLCARPEEARKWMDRDESIYLRRNWAVQIFFKQVLCGRRFIALFVISWITGAAELCSDREHDSSPSAMINLKTECHKINFPCNYKLLIFSQTITSKEMPMMPFLHTCMRLCNA